MKLILFVMIFMFYALVYDMIQYIYLMYSTSSGCIQPVYIYLNITNKYK